MTNKEKIEKEHKRTKDILNVIYLFRDGNSPWYSAYEWSAYLLEFYPNGLSDDKRLKVTRKTQKDLDDSYIKVGFQLPSLKNCFIKQKIQYLGTGFFYSSSHSSSSISSSTLSLTAFASSAIFSFPLLNLYSK